LPERGEGQDPTPRPTGPGAPRRRTPIRPGRLLAIARKEVIQLRRDPRSLALAFALPLLLLILFGYAITWDVNHIATAVLDQDGTARSRDLVSAFRSSGYFDLTATLHDTGEIAPILDRGAARLALVIPPDFASDLDAGRTARLQAIVDGSDANTATIALAYTQAIVRTFSSNVALQGRRLALPIRAESRVWYNEELTSRNMIVPGLVAVIMMIIAAMLTSLTIAREWERGTMEQLAATPVARLEVVLGKLLPYLGIGILDVTGSSVLGVLLFGVPFRGSPALLMILSLAFLIGTLGLGLFISAVARSQLLATQMAMIATFLPAFLLSGFMFSIQVMPKPLQALTYLIPARYFLVVTRGIFLKGVGVEVLRVQGLLMIAFAVVGLALAARVFRKEIL
jgi:drug efflux transport system permease protein